MLSDEEIQQLKNENWSLRIQLADITEMVNLLEEEIEILRKKAAQRVSLQSTLEGTLDQIAQMQLIIGDQDQKAAGAARREAGMEEEIIQSIDMEREFYTIRDKYEHSKIALADLDNELAETASMYKQLAASISRIAELEAALK